ncbi:GNAT family N-acetyltransferase [Rossellomorea sp. H39__3]
MMVSIQLRELRQTDWQAVHRYASLEIVSRYQPWGPNSEEETRQYVDEVLRDAAKKDRTRFTFAVILEGELIGCGELTICDRSNLTGKSAISSTPSTGERDCDPPGQEAIEHRLPRTWSAPDSSHL